LLLKLEFHYEASAEGFLRVEGAFSLQVGQDEFPPEAFGRGRMVEVRVGQSFRTCSLCGYVCTHNRLTFFPFV
jgi:hypothetical protein